MISSLNLTSSSYLFVYLYSLVVDRSTGDNGVHINDVIDQYSISIAINEPEMPILNELSIYLFRVGCNACVNLGPLYRLGLAKKS